MEDQLAALEEEYADFKQDYEIKKRQFINRLEENGRLWGDITQVKAQFTPIPRRNGSHYPAKTQNSS